MSRTRVKICGITSIEDALAAAAAGADMLGLVFADSARQVSLERAKTIASGVQPSIVVVGVFMDQDRSEVNRVIRKVDLDMIQLHGSESFEYCCEFNRGIIKRFDVRPDDTPARLARRVAMYGTTLSVALVDPGAGSGRTFDWNLAREVEWPLMVSGGLNPTNVSDAVRAVRPYGVDVSSGVESRPGVKDHEKVRAFVNAVRRADAEN